MKRFLLVFLISFFFIFNVKAYEITTNYNASQVGSVKFNDVNQLLWVMNGEDLNQRISFWFNVTDTDFFAPPFEKGSKINVELDYCATGDVLNNVFSTYTNSFDYDYNTHQICNFSSFTGEVHKAFFTLTLENQLIETIVNGSNNDNYYMYSMILTTQDLYFVNNNGYNVAVRYLSLTYYSPEDYTSLIETYKNNQSQKDVSDKLDETNELIGGDSDDVQSKSCGIICKLKNLLLAIIDLPGKIIELLTDALLSLIVPTNEQIMDIVADSSEMAENFGFVGQAIDFFIKLFTDLLSMVEGSGCATLPEFTIPFSQLNLGIDDVTFWSEQNVCLADNPILSDNIDTIRAITSIALVSLFVTFAGSQFFSIMSKQDNSSLGATYDQVVRDDNRKRSS